MNKPRLRFEIYRWPISIIPDMETIPEYNKATRSAAVFGIGAGIRVGTYYKAALDGMQEAVRSKGRIFEFDSPEYKEYYGLDEVFKSIHSEETNVQWDGEFND